MIPGRPRRAWLVLAGCLLLPLAALAGEPSLEVKSVSKDKAGRKVYHLKLTAPPDRAVYVETDRDTRLLVHAVQVRKGTGWTDAGAPWCAAPAWPKVAAGKSADFTIPQPEARGELRVGVDLYAKPEPGQKPARVWSAPLP